MRDAKIKKLVLAALMAALTYVATSIVQIPSPMQGYVNLGDCIVLLSGWILGPWWALRLAASAPCWWICWAATVTMRPAR